MCGDCFKILIYQKAIWPPDSVLGGGGVAGTRLPPMERGKGRGREPEARSSKPAPGSVLEVEEGGSLPGGAGRSNVTSILLKQRFGQKGQLQVVGGSISQRIYSRSRE